MAIEEHIKDALGTAETFVTIDSGGKDGCL